MAYGVGWGDEGGAPVAVVDALETGGGEDEAGEGGGGGVELAQTGVEVTTLERITSDKRDDQQLGCRSRSLRVSGM